METFEEVFYFLFDISTALALFFLPLGFAMNYKQEHPKAFRICMGLSALAGMLMLINLGLVLFFRIMSLFCE